MPEPTIQSEPKYPPCMNCNENCPRSNLFKCVGQNCRQIFCWACIDDIDNNGFPIEYDVQTGRMICPLCMHLFSEGGLILG